HSCCRGLVDVPSSWSWLHVAGDEAARYGGEWGAKAARGTAFREVKHFAQK
ncbi:hypothetical protein GOP47_0013851, partial [Adiantum capillus-veneris]